MTFDTALGQMLSGTDRERLKVTNTLLDACIHDYRVEVPEDLYCSMGVSMGTSGFYVVVSLVPPFDGGKNLEPRHAMYIGRAREWSDLDALIERYNVRACLISPQPEPHLAQNWVSGFLDSIAQLIIYTNDGLSEPEWDRDQRRVTVDRTFALNSAFEEIKAGQWWIPPGIRTVDNGDFYAQMKAPTRVRDMTDGTLRYRWVETGPLEHYRHAQAFDHVAAEIARKNPLAAMVGGADEEAESEGLLGDYSRYFFDGEDDDDWA